MNSRAPANKRYQPTEYEHAANCATHAVSYKYTPWFDHVHVCGLVVWDVFPVQYGRLSGRDLKHHLTENFCKRVALMDEPLTLKKKKDFNHGPR